MGLKKIYLIKNLSPWMMEELLAFSKKTRFSVYLLRNPHHQYEHGLDILRSNEVEIRICPYLALPELRKLVFVVRFIFTHLPKFLSGYSAVIGWKSAYWFLKLDDRQMQEELSIHAQFATQPALIAHMLKTYLKVPVKYYFTFHAYDIYFKNKWFSLLVNQSDASFSISEFNMMYVSERFKGLDKAKLVLSRLGAVCPPELNEQKSRGDFVLGFIGRLVPKKGLRFLLEAMKMLQDELPDLRLIIAGDGPLAGEIKEIVDRTALSNVKLTGALQGKEKVDFFRQIDVFVAPSVPVEDDMDGIPVVMMEAAGCQLPMIASRISGLPEICVDRVNGILVPPADALALAGAIRYLYQNPDVCRSFGEQSARISKEFDLEKNSYNKLMHMQWLN